EAGHSVAAVIPGREPSHLQAIRQGQGQRPIFLDVANEDVGHRRDDNAYPKPCADALWTRRFPWNGTHPTCLERVSQTTWFVTFRNRRAGAPIGAGPDSPGHQVCDSGPAVGSPPLPPAPRPP